MSACPLKDLFVREQFMVFLDKGLPVNVASKQANVSWAKHLISEATDLNELKQALLEYINSTEKNII